MPPLLVLSSTKRIATQILVITKLNGKKDLVLISCASDMIVLSKQLLVPT